MLRLEKQPLHLSDKAKNPKKTNHKLKCDKAKELLRDIDAHTVD